MTETTFGIVFWMAVIQLPLSLIGGDPMVFFHLETRHILPAIGVGIGGLTSHYCLSNAFRAGDATLVVPLDFMRIPLIAVVGWAFYGERLDLFVPVSYTHLDVYKRQGLEIADGNRDVIDHGEVISRRGAGFHELINDRIHQRLE